MKICTCPNCGNHFDPAEHSPIGDNVIWPCSRTIDEPSEIMTSKFECSVCGKYFYHDDHPYWTASVVRKGERAASNDRRP